MGQLFEQVRRAVAQDRFVVTDHADERLREREVMAWQVVAGIEQARLLSERPDDAPFPSIEAEQLLANGTPVKVVWSWVARGGFARLVTVHFFDR